MTNAKIGRGVLEAMDDSEDSFFRAIDLTETDDDGLDTSVSLPDEFKSFDPPVFDPHAEPVDSCEPAAASDGNFRLFGHPGFDAPENGSDGYEPSFADGAVETGENSHIQIPTPQWDMIVSASFGQYAKVDDSLKLPWETGVMAEIFGGRDLPALPSCVGLAEKAVVESLDAGDNAMSSIVASEFLQSAKYVHAVKSMPDVSYFESKHQKLDLACGQWLNILGLDWSASGIGPQLASALQADYTGHDATEILKACFGVKSPSTLLKRASSFKKFFGWYDKHGMNEQFQKAALPLQEEAVWQYFLHLRDERRKAEKGFTVPSSFLESVRFAKFACDMNGTDEILASRRLLGLAAIEKRDKGPTRQAPGLELEHLQKLHSVLMSGENLIDRVGAGAFLICVYGRARWSDTRFVDHVEINRQRNGNLTLFTTEHKTASVGLRREQYLPLVIPWEGVTNDSWLDEFLKVYSEVGLDITKRPLGPLLPAPRRDGTFGARPLSTCEAAAWLRALLEGTTDSHMYRSHSLKATLLIWSAKAGLDKETRSVLGHHCSAVSGSEVVYSRHLQTRALRKLSMMLRRVRVGLGLEDENMRDFGVVSTPLPFTPAVFMQSGAPQTPELPVAAEGERLVSAAEAGGDTTATGHQVVDRAIEQVLETEELQSCKGELEELGDVEQAAEHLTLFSADLAASGAVEIESSSGSDSSSSDESSSSDSDGPAPVRHEPQFREDVPANLDFYKHVKSGIVHACSRDDTVSKCKVKMSSNFKLQGRVLSQRLPKCIRCFPKDNNRIRNLDDLNNALDESSKKRKF